MGFDYVEPVKMRQVVLKDDWYLPNIHFAELIKLTSEDSPRLRLRLIGQNLTHIVLRKSLFSFGFPFATNPEKVRKLCDLFIMYFQVDRSYQTLVIS